MYLIRNVWSIKYIPDARRLFFVFMFIENKHFQNFIQVTDIQNTYIITLHVTYI